jgi:outer membrane protein assembly factor BamB
LTLCLSLILAGFPAFAQSFDWPQWQRPDRTAFSKESGFLKEWPKEGPPLKWRARDRGTGYSAPALVGGKVYFMSYKGGNRAARPGALGISLRTLYYRLEEYGE